MRPGVFLRIQRQRAQSLGISVDAIAQTLQGALSGTDAAWMHDGQSKYPVPVRLQLPREAQVGIDALLAMPMRTASGQLVSLSELVKVEKSIVDKSLYTKDLQRLSYVFGDIGRVEAPAATCPTHLCTACLRFAGSWPKPPCPAPVKLPSTGSVSPSIPIAPMPSNGMESLKLPMKPSGTWVLPMELA